MDQYHYECSVCKKSVDERVYTIWNKVTGWEKRRDQGGTNGLALRQPQNLFMCDPCMKKAKAGIDPGQRSMFSTTLERKDSNECLGST